MKNIKILSIFLMLVFAFASCEKNDFTGDSSQTPTNPTITVDYGTIPTVIDGVDYKHKITLNMDVAQIVDVVVHIAVLEGTATQDVDFAVPSKVTIPAGRTSASFEVSFFADELAEETETFKIKIGDDLTANATLVPVEVDFSIENYTENDLKVGLTWESVEEVNDISGSIIGATDLANMILTIYDIAGDSVLISVDGDAFEELILSDTIADGDYRTMISFNEAYDLGDQGGADLNLKLNLFQIGIQNNSTEYKNALNTEDNLQNTLHVSIITKAGNTWTMANFEGFLASDFNFASSSWNGKDGAAPGYMFDNQVVVAGTAGNYTISGLNFAWMVNVWGETITSSNPVNITFADDGTLEIPDQYYLTTDYNGDPYPYNISGTGTWNRIMTPIAISVHYEMNQEGFLVAAYGYAQGWWAHDYFEADLVQGSSKRTYAVPSFEKIDKPLR